MAKVKTRKEKVGVPAGMTASDLSLEKRVELYNVAFEKFKAENSEAYGLTLEVEIFATPRAIVPRLTLVDLLKKNEQKTDNPSTEAEA